jgi:hypothetical protein
MAFVAGLAVAICWRGSMASSFSQAAAAILKDRSGVGAAELLVIGVLLSVVFALRDENLLSRSDLLTMAATALAFAIPMRLAAIVPLTAVAMKLLFRRDPRLSSIGQLLIALAFYEWIGPAVFHLVSPIALQVETSAVQGLLAPLGGFTRDGLTISGGLNGHSIAMEEGCSAFHNLSLATLIWICLVKLETLTMQPLHWRLLAAMAVATVGLNCARIAAMAQSYPLYDYWHNGPGVPILSAAMLAVILAVFLVGRALAEKP